MKNILLAFATAMLIATFAQAQQVAGDGNNGKGTDQAADGMGIFPAAKVKWTNGPASLPPGAKLAVLEGDPTRKDSAQCVCGCPTVSRLRHIGIPR